MEDSCASLNRVKLRDGRLLAYREGGVPKEEAKHKIILVHGLGGSKDMDFSASKELIEELGVYILYYDRSGYGESDLNAKRSLESEVEDIAELADEMEIGPKFYLIGVSLGSYPTWGCLKHIPHRLSGVAFVAPAVNYLWPSLPGKLIKKDYRRVVINWCVWILKYAPGLLHRCVIQKLFLSTMFVLESTGVFFSSHDVEVHKGTNFFPMLTEEKRPEKNVYDALTGDLVSCFEQWDFEPADLCIGQESSVHIWHGKRDRLIPFQLQRCILQKQPFINFHEIPQGGHLIVRYDGIRDAILRALLLGETIL